MENVTSVAELQKRLEIAERGYRALNIELEGTREMLADARATSDLNAAALEKCERERDEARRVFNESMDKSNALADTCVGLRKDLAATQAQERELRAARDVEVRRAALEEAATHIELEWELDRPAHGIRTPNGDRARKIAASIRALSKPELATEIRNELAPKSQAESGAPKIDLDAHHPSEHVAGSMRTPPVCGALPKNARGVADGVACELPKGHGFIHQGARGAMWNGVELCHHDTLRSDCPKCGGHSLVATPPVCPTCSICGEDYEACKCIGGPHGSPCTRPDCAGGGK